MRSLFYLKMAKDYYEILGVSKSANQDEIKSSYKKLAIKHHPDRNQGDKKSEEKFKEINEAYDTLKDENKRAQYDRFGTSGNQGGFGGGGGFGGFDFSDMSSVFSEMEGMFGFGGGRSQKRQAQKQPGSDLRYTLQISLKDAYDGIVKNIKFRTFVSCGTCKGSGSKSGKSSTCGTCKGSGTMRMQEGWFIVETTCNTCGGGGQSISDPCGTCNSTGRVEGDVSIDVTIPKGVSHGQKIILNGKGEAGFRGGSNGNLHVIFSINEHEFFKRDGHDLHCSVDVKFTLAMLGGEVEIPTISGKNVVLDIPQNTQYGSIIKVKGDGMPKGNSGFGDLYVEIKTEFPSKLTSKQKDLLLEFDKTISEDDTPISTKFMRMIKNMMK